MSVRFNPRELFVRRGDPIRPAWNRLVEFAAGLKIYGGPGILVAPRVGGGVTISARQAVQGFRHPWRTDLAGTGATMEPGLVNGVFPFIGAKRMDERPLLPLSDRVSPSGFNAAGRSWIALRVRTDPATGRILRVDVVQTDRLDAGRGLSAGEGGAPEVVPGVAFDPLVMFNRPEDVDRGFGEVFQIRYFHVTHRVNLANPGGPRHFFF